VGDDEPAHDQEHVAAYTDSAEAADAQWSPYEARHPHRYDDVRRFEAPRPLSEINHRGFRPGDFELAV